MIKEIEAKSILRKQKKIESWFLTSYGMNLYRGCQHNCVYCDGRSEKYRVDGEFGEDVVVKINAINLLQRELDPNRKRTSLKKGYMGVGGGVGDSYQPAEKKYKLTRKTLRLLYERNLPVHVLTKSTLVKRDIDILKKINKKTKAIVSFSFSSTDDKISKIFEPGVPPPSERLKIIKMFKEKGISCGMYLMPVIPFITDNREKIEETVREASEAGIDFIIFSGLTLKRGRQKDYYINVLKTHYPKLIVDYHNIYKGDKWGSPIISYYDSINLMFNNIAKTYKMPIRIPLSFFRNILSENDLVVVLLEHIDYLLKMKGRKSPFGYASHSISQINTPLSKLENDLKKIKGVGNVTERIILEIIKTGTSSYYENLSNL
jgi:DNA repair photolyase